MAYKNIKELLVDATKFPAAIEAKLPEAVPKLSTTMADVAGQIPAVPDFPMEIPSLPAPPELPAMPAMPAAPTAGLRRYITAAEVTPATRAPVAAAPPAAVVTRPTSEIIPLLFE